MFWGDAIVGRILEERKAELKARGKLVIRDEKTASGRVHVGSMRAAAINGIVSEILSEYTVANEYLFEINDFDPMDGIPVYLDRAVYEPYLGKPLYTIPSPDGKAKNYAEYFAAEYTGVIEESGFHPEYYRARELYRSGRMNEVIRAALEKADVIRKIYKEVSGSERSDRWLPLNVVCDKCGKISTTKAVSFDGEKVSYRCAVDAVEWAKGCGFEGSISPFDGNAKLPWKVEWGAKFKVVGVSIEGSGKDHATKGGAREVADRICREVFEYEPPFNIKYEFFLVGGRKMSSSKGAGSSAREIADLLPPHIFRLVLIGKDINQAINFSPSGDTIPVLFDTYDRLAEKYFGGIKDDDTRLFELCHLPEDRKLLARVFLPRFSQVAFLVQMPHMDIIEEVARIKGGPLSSADKAELEMRARYARIWLEREAPEEFKYEIQKEVPEAARHLNDAQKKSLLAILAIVSEEKNLNGQDLHTRLHEVRKELGIEPKDFFSAIYLSVLGKENGPKAGWFLSVLDKEFLTKRLNEVI